MEKIIEVYVVLENKPNAAGDMFRILKKKGVDVFAVGLFGDSARIYVSDHETTLQTLRDNNYVADQREVLRVILPNKRGNLKDLTLKLGNAGININYLYGALEPDQDKGAVILEVDNTQLALDLFRNHKF